MIIKEGKKEGDIHYLLTTDEDLLDFNRTHLNHDTYTDIITFPSSENLEIISGDIIISLDRVDDNAKKFAQNFEQELSRVLVHGVLHLIGYEDHSKAEKKEMRSKEDYYLSLQPEI